MQVSFNPYITNQQQIKQPTHKAVIQKYVKEAERQIKVMKCINSRILLKLLDDIILFKEYSVQDGIDTLEKIKEFTPNILKTINDYLEVLHRELEH